MGKESNLASITTHLSFNGNCREAMTFYQECLGGELNLQTIGESPMASHMPPEVHTNILHATLVKDNFALLAADSMESEARVPGNAVSLCLNCNSEEEAKTCFANLSAGGKIKHPLEKAFWGATFGDLTDKFGISWMFVADHHK